VFCNAIEDLPIRMNFDMSWSIMSSRSTRWRRRGDMSQLPRSNITGVNFDSICPKNRYKTQRIWWGWRWFDSMRAIFLRRYITTLEKRANRDCLQVQLVFYLPEIAPILEQTKFLVFSARSLQYFCRPGEPLLSVPPQSICGWKGVECQYRTK